MLTGRASLVRLIGSKQRRFLINEDSLLSSPFPSDTCLNFHNNNNNNATSSSEDKQQQQQQEQQVKEEENFIGPHHQQQQPDDWVTCPVCGTKIRDSIINSHLDSCLSTKPSTKRGTKRKLIQPTLLQLMSNVSSSSKVELPSNHSLRLGDHEDDDDDDDDRVSSPRSNECTPIGLGLVTDSVVCTDTDTRHENLFSVDEEKNYDKLEDVVGMVLETYIVGRRFSDEKELKAGATVSMLRDPHNVKDPYAIKVVSEECGSSKMLGFLPKDLAQYLSPLIDTYGLKFEGCLTSVPEHSLNVVPIQIVCHKLTVDVDQVNHNTGDFQFLWKKTLHVIESMKGYPPNGTKYQQNFCLLIREVLKINPHLFTDHEKCFLESFASLSEDAQRLFVRLYSRKGFSLPTYFCFLSGDLALDICPWFRMSNISYPEVADVQQTVEELSAQGYICSFQHANEMPNDVMKEILSLLTVAELHEISYLLNKNRRRSRKQDLVSSLLSSWENGSGTFISSAILKTTRTCIRISSTAEYLIWRVERLFFLSGEQDLSTFLLVDLGIVKYPSYACVTTEKVFRDQSDLLAYEEAIEVAQIIDHSLDENNTDLVLRCIAKADSHIDSSSLARTEVIATFLSCFSSSWVYSKVVLLGISFLERERRYNDAINLLKRLLSCFTCDRRRGYWTLRLSIDLEHIGYPNESLSVAEEALLDTWVRAGSRVALQRRVLRLSKPPRRWKTPSFSESINRKITEVQVIGRPLNCEVGMKNRFYGEDGEQCGVEELALQYYAANGGGWKGVHSESGIWLTLFGLLMWDILFATVPNVFYNRFQTAPLDLETDSFYTTRKSLIELQLQKIRDGVAEEILIISWESHQGTACKGVNWDRHSLSELRAAVTCIGGLCLASLCRNLAQDYRSWSSGMPDLLLWRFHGEYNGEAKLVEVKGPRDRLSEQQRAWLLLLMDCGFNVEVCKVSPEAASM
ncbi:hypothetical protein ACFE04_008730 [Oxalis oulophora]